ncbi:MAG: site-specific DNA-methyltransferase [Sphingobacteriales bacterium]|nr:MAG: site-specific DNA-methyltransferase [Sphingobacteriales bacterium]
MSNKKQLQKLELTWIGKGEEPKLEPRILIENPEYSYGDPNSPNMLIHGDNLLALKALEQDYAGKVKCIYIDPPYNTGQAFEHYDDGVEHSLWLSLMNSRLKILQKLLANDGVIFVQLDDNEISYCRVMMDEIFGRQNFINQVAVKMKNTAGASGGGEDKKLKKNIEFILIYAKSYESSNGFKKFNDVYEEENLFDLIDDMEAAGKSWKYTSVIISPGSFVEQRIVYDGSGDEIIVKKYKGLQRTTINQLQKSTGLSREELYAEHFENIFSDTNAQTSIRTRIMDEFIALENDEVLISSYIPKSGKDKGQRVEHMYISPTIRRVIWLKDSCEKRGKFLFKREKLGTYWSGFPLNNLTKEGNVQFPNGKKPESLIERILELSTSKDDLVLDSFLGSGTTAATAIKLGRNFIGVELGNHSITHCVPRLNRVIEGTDQGGISKAVNWQGGGGFKFYTLAPSLLKQDKFGNWVISQEYNADMLAAAMAKQEGFKYQPHESTYWKQGQSSEQDFIFTTTQFLTVEALDSIKDEMQPGETLLICCKSFQKECKGKFGNITIKKIPLMLLGRCEYGKEDYSLNIINMPVDDSNEDAEDTIEEISVQAIRDKNKSADQTSLF